MGREIPADTWAKYQKLRDLGYSQRRAADAVGISSYSARQYEQGLVTTTSAKIAASIPALAKSLQAEVPKAYDELGDEARLALEDFDYFRWRYFGRKTKPWQVEAAQAVVDRIDTPDREWVVMNEPPGAGKTTTFTHDIPIWLIARNRQIRILLGSRTSRQATGFSGRVRASLMRKVPMQGAEATLAEDYGAFQPPAEYGELWRRSEFIVWSHQGEDLGEKEPTVSAFGMDSAFLGGRFDLSVWDDLVDSSTIRTESARTNQREWYDDEAESRLEPGGLHLLVGQRLSPNDLYRYALDKVTEEYEPGHPEANDEGYVESPRYQHVVFQAHYDDRCTEDHRPQAPAYPDGCLLDPERLGWRDLMAIRKNNPRKFDVLYQQKDVDPEGVLVPREFIEGCEDWHGYRLPGCLDQDRGVTQFPSTADGILPPGLVSAMTVDPSPTKYWAIQWWVYEPESQRRFLMDAYRGKLDAPEFLERGFSGNFTGMAVDWVQRAHDLGLPIAHLIFEANAAQKFVMQYRFFEDWLSASGVSLIPHSTHLNKLDAELGVQASLKPQYQWGRVRLPWGDPHAKMISSQLIDEVTTWPEGNTEDQVMAQWFFEFNLENLRASQMSLPTRKGVPSWVRATA